MADDRPDAAVVATGAARRNVTGADSPARSLPRRLLATPTPVLFGVSLAVALGLLWRQGSLVDLGEAARGADLGLLLLAGVLYLVGLALLCVRWHALVLMVAGASDLARAAEAFLTSVVVNYAAPIGLAVPTRAYLTKRALGLSVVETGSVALWEVIADVVILGLAAIVWIAAGNSSAVGGVPGGQRTVASVVGAIVLGAAAGIGVAWQRPMMRRRAANVGRQALGYPVHRPGAAGVAFGVTVAFWLLQAVIFGVLLEAVGIAATSGLVVGLLALPVLVGMLSPVPGGAGVREALMIAVAQAREVNGAAVLLAAVAYRVALFLAIPVLYGGVRIWMGTAHGRADDMVGQIDGSERG